MFGRSSHRVCAWTMQLRIAFSWFDAFKPRNKSSMYSWDFESAAVWYNLAALHSLQGAHQDRSGPEGIKAAHSHFQQAVAIFTHLKNEVVPALEGSVPAEFTQPGLDLCIELHRGHAQSCFYEKAKLANMKPGVLARLAMQASIMYGSAATHAKVRPACWPVPHTRTHPCTSPLPPSRAPFDFISLVPYFISRSLSATGPGDCSPPREGQVGRLLQLQA